MIARVRHRAFYIATVAATLSCISAVWVSPLMVVVIAANAFFAVHAALSLAHLSRLQPAALRAEAPDDDIPVWVIFLITLGAAATAIAALFVSLNVVERPGTIELLLAFLAVPLGWMTIHLMAAIHYAHLYWQAKPGGEPRRGLEFPGIDNPGGIEFIYFSLVIGMTAQTSDVAITSSELRKVNVAHAVISFFFNTVLVAAAVNAAVTLSN